LSGLLMAGLSLGSALAKNKEKTPVLKDQYVQVSGLRIHCVTAGKGPLILFLHGFPEFWYEWKNQLTELARIIWRLRPICAATTFPISPTTRSNTG